MYYEDQGHYEAAMNAQAQAEGEAQAEQDRLAVETTEKQHSPLPWKIFGNKEDGRIGTDKHEVAMVRGWSYLLESHGVDAPRIMDANRDFILEACNNYYKLKDQIASLTTELEQKREEVEKWKSGYELGVNKALELQEEINRLKHTDFRGDLITAQEEKWSLTQQLQASISELQSVKEDRDKLQKFKYYVHDRLDKMGVPVDPESPHKAAGCRIGGRLDYVESVKEDNQRLREAKTSVYLLVSTNSGSVHYVFDDREYCEEYLSKLPGKANFVIHEHRIWKSY
jgi:DNA repair exonuclease SbcCD ATPase subunit